MTIFGGSRSVAVKLGLDAKGYATGLATAGKATADFARAADKSLGKHRKSFDEIGNAAGKAGLIIGAGAAAAVVSFAKFDQSMSRAAAGTQATAGQMDALRKAAIGAGRDTQFSATEAADAITAMGKAGVGVNDILGGGLSGALSLAAAGELGVADAAEIAATAMTQFGLGGKDLPHVADLLAAGAGKAQGSVADLAGALKYVGPVAKNANVSIEETVGVLAELASQGIIGEQAGTSLRGVLLALESPTKASAKAMKGLGVNLYDANGKFIGLQAAAGVLHQQLGGLTEAERNAALGTIFGNEQITAATVLYKGGAGAVRDWTAKVNDAGYASRQAGQLMNNLAGDFEQLKGSLETALISSGSGANSGLRSLTQGATSAVNAFTALPDPIQRSTVVVAGLAAGALLLTAGVIKGAIAVKTMRTNLAELGITASATGRTMAAVGKGAAVLTALSFVPDLNQQVDQATGAIGSNLSTMQLELANFARGSALAGESARIFGADLKGGIQNGLTATQDLKGAVNDLSGANGFFGKDLPFLKSHESEQIGQLSQALAGLARTDAPAAAQAFDRLAKAGGLSGEETQRLLRLMPEYNSVLSDVAATQVATGQAAAGTADAMTVMQGDLSKAGDSASALAGKLKDVRDAARDLNSAFLSSRSSARDYQQSLDDAANLLTQRGKAGQKIADAQAELRKAKTPEQRRRATEAVASAREEAAKYAAGLDITTEAGRRNQSALDGIASAAQGQADALLKAGGTDAEYRASIAASRVELEKMAVKFGLSKSAAKLLADELLRLPADVSTDVKVTGLDTALSALDQLIGKQAIINGKTTTINASVNSGNVREDRGGATVRTPVRAPGYLKPRAGGGPVAAGRGYWVGENGPEQFWPSQSGQILPSRMSMPAGGGVSSSVHVVRVPVRESSTTNAPTNIRVDKLVVRDASAFTDWGNTAARFGSGGVTRS